MSSGQPSEFSARVAREAGYSEAMLGLSLSYGQTWEPDTDVGKLKGYEVMARLCSKDGGHNKFLEAMQVWLDITGPRYWWQEFDTYRIGTSRLSGSTMHTILKEPLTNRNFNTIIKGEYLEYLNCLREERNLLKLKKALPEGFMQRRIVSLNYKVLRGMYAQRRRHKLEEWRELFRVLEAELGFWEFVK